IAYFADRSARRGKSWVNHPAIYALSLAVYCTAWTYYGSVGRAATSGIGFAPIYLGPLIIAPVWVILARKLILICKSQGITSVADFVSSRYGKSTRLGVIATLLAVMGIVPYISIQLKAIASSFELLVFPNGPADGLTEGPIFQDSAFYITVVLALFAILFGTRHLDPNERHEGLIAAIAFESIFKLVAFLTVGVFVTFFVYDGFGDLFSRAVQVDRINAVLDLQASNVNAWSWFWLNLLSMSAILFLPRQFHVGIVENISRRHVNQAAWMFPLYLLLINIFVLPIAFGGMMHFPDATIGAPHGHTPDTFVLDLPLFYQQKGLALFAVLGGLSAGTSMVIVSTLALSIMIGNNLVVPLLLRSRSVQEDPVNDLSSRLLGIRRVSIVVVLLLAFAYFKSVGQGYTLVSIGLISFTAVAQFAPVILAGLFWTRGTSKGALAGLLTGFLVWGYTLPIPTLAEVGILSNSFVEQGPFGIALLKPHELFGLSGLDHVSHSAFWSLFLNIVAFVMVSLYTRQSPADVAQAEVFVNIYKYQCGNLGYDLRRRQPRVSDVRDLLVRFLGEERARILLRQYALRTKTNLDKLTRADAGLINFAESQLSSAIGAASAKVIIGSISKEDPISLEEMLEILDQTQEVIQYSKELERKSKELEQTTHQLQRANEQLKELDRLKADFITTVTHELRTPLTSIKSISKILQDNLSLPLEQKAKFLNIIVNESERLARLINQVLDLEKIQSMPLDGAPMDLLNLVELVDRSFQSLTQLMQEQGVEYKLQLGDGPIQVLGNADQLMQVLINLLSNAIKFCDPEKGRVEVSVGRVDELVEIRVRDNGIGISEEDQEHIFDQFTQVSSKKLGKPKGSGLGLYITRRIIERHQGKLAVESRRNAGATFIVQLPVHHP
ncbi:MAG: hypothetical protein KDC44_00790, partial [Phaeodactylibacter sp.]|nr:hypothetical protein [Phaeodactylibacter sp.]